MRLSFRVLAAVCVLALAAMGCEKAKQPGAEKAASDKAGSGEGGSKSGSRAYAKTSERGGAAASERRETATGGARGRVSTLTAEDDGGTFDLRKGQVLSVVLHANRSTGLSWAMVQGSGTVLVPEGNPVYVAKKDGGTETWHFRAAKPGRQTVRLEYRRKWAQSVPERTFRFTATVR